MFLVRLNSLDADVSKKSHKVEAHVNKDNNWLSV